jgi:tetratricopeptide (TPR) repeat protein
LTIEHLTKYFILSHQHLLHFKFESTNFNQHMQKRLFPIFSALLLIGTSSNPSLAAFPLPGDDPHERHILPFRLNEYAINSCKEYLYFDKFKLKEILARRVGADISDKDYEKAIARLNALLKAVEVSPSTQIKSDFLLNIFNPYLNRESLYDGALVNDFESSIYLNRPEDVLVEQLVRQSLVNPKISAEAVLNQIEALNQPLGSAYGVPKAITFMQLSRQFSLLAQGNGQSQRFHRRALAQLQAASSTIDLIRNAPLQINMLIILGRRYAAIGEMKTAKTLLDRSVQLLQQTKSSNTNQAEHLSRLLGSFQVQLGQFESALATSGVNIELIAAMLKSRSPQSVLPLAQTLTDPETKVQALGLVAIALAQQGQSDQGRKILEESIRAAPLNDYPYDIDHPFFPGNASPRRKATIRVDLVFPLIWDYAKTGQRESALEIAQSTGSKVIVMALKAVIANEYARKRDPRAQPMMDEVKTQMNRTSQKDTEPVVSLVFADLMENHQYRFAWDMVKAIDAEAWESYLRMITPTAPLSWPFLEQMHNWQAEVITAAIADKRYDIALEAARHDYRLLEVVTPSIVEAGLTDKLLLAARKVEPFHRAEALSAIALKLEQQQNLAQAKRIWTEAITAAQQLKEGRQRSWALIHVAAKLQNTPHQAQVDALLQHIVAMDNAFRHDNSYQSAPIIPNTVEAALIEQSPRLVIRLVEAMPPGLHRDRNRIFLFQNLLSFFYEYLPEAEGVLATIPKSALKVRSQVALADAYFTWGELKKSSAMLNQSQMDLQQVPDAEIIKARNSIGVGESDLFGRNRIPWLLKKDSRSSLLGYIALGHTKIQDRARAAQVLQTIPNVQVQREWRSHLACYSAPS